MILQIMGGLIMVAGLFFFTVGVIGIFRLPDVHSRLHASGKVATLGLFGVLLGGGLIMPDYLPRLVLIGLFFILTAPAASHVIAMSDRTSKLDRPFEEIEQLGIR